MTNALSDSGDTDVVRDALAKSSLSKNWLPEEHRTAWSAVLFLTWLAQGTLDQSLRLIHAAGERGFGIAAISGGRSRADEAIKAWDNGSEPLIDLDLLALPGDVIAMLSSLTRAVWWALLIGIVSAVGRELDDWLDSQAEDHGDNWQIRSALTTARLAVYGLLVAVLMRVILELLVINGVSALASLLQLARLGIYVLIGSIVFPFLATFFWRRTTRLRGAERGATDDRPEFKMPSVARVQIGVMIAFGIAATFGVLAGQSQDAVRLWETTPAHGLWAIIGLLLLSVVLALTGGRMMTRDNDNVDRLAFSPAGYIGVGLRVAAIGFAAAWAFGSGVGITAFGAVLAFIGIVSWPLSDSRERSNRAHENRLLKALGPKLKALVGSISLFLRSIARWPYPVEPTSTPHSISQWSAILIRWLFCIGPPKPATGQSACTPPIYAVRRDVATDVVDPATLRDTAGKHVRAAVAIPWIAVAGLATNALIRGVLGGAGQPTLLVFWMFLVILPMGIDRVLKESMLDRVLAIGVSNDDRLKRLDWRVFFIVGAVLFVALHVLVSRSPFSVPSAIGVVGLVVLFLAEVVFVLGVLGHIAGKMHPPDGLRLLGYRRMPVVAPLVAWVLVAMMFDRNSSMNDVRRMQAEGAERSSADLSEQLSWWVDSMADAETSAGDGDASAGDLHVEPLVLVAAHGGGIKAAAWTSLVLDCVYGRLADSCPVEAQSKSDRSINQIFAMSGASGGTVGLASTIAESISTGAATDAAVSPSWVRDRLGEDLLSNSIGWQLFTEVPLAFLRIPTGMDRAEVLERTWSRQWEDAGARDGSGSNTADSACRTSVPGESPFYALWSDARGGACPRLPLLISNGMSVRDGCYVNISGIPGEDDKPRSCDATTAPPEPEPVAGDEATMVRSFSTDLADWLCDGEDIPLATAAFLSARFPYVSPSGRVAACKVDQEGGAPLHVADGGYRDNTGTAALADLLIALQPSITDARRNGVCIVPVVVEISSGYRDDSVASPGGTLYEAVVPLSGAVGAFGSRDRDQPERLRTLVRVAAGPPPSEVDRYFEFGLHSSPTVEAPLGWLLSQDAVASLEAQLDGPANEREFKRLGESLQRIASAKACS